MGKIIYRRNNFTVQEVYNHQKKGYILSNDNKDFQEGHTHLNNLKSTKYLIMLIEKQKLPLDLDTYRLESIVRVSDNGEYQEKAKALLKLKKSKEIKKYINVPKKYVIC